MSSGRGQFVEIEFSLEDDAYPAVRISRALDCRLDLLDALRTGDGTTAFFHVLSGDADRIVEQGRRAEREEHTRLVERFDDECVVETTLSQSVFGALADAKVPLQSMVVTGGTAHWVATVPPGRTSAELVSAVKARHPAVELVGKRRTDIAAPFAPRVAFQAMLDERLTGRQLDALSLAFEHGYFERPRRTTQRELAEEMDISPSTFGQHLHAALRKLLATLFAGGETAELPRREDDG